MAIPIKDRGIRWVESYSGEKSAQLKKDMDSQIGPGAYCRWEGHDSVTGNDYYVVVSPGFSKKKGFHFFAGLRKMPADHGASGKKFSNQREAMSHARETWQVPPPKDRPPTTQGYTVNDIKNAPVLMEIQHKGVTSSSSPSMTREATFKGSVGVQPNVKRRVGRKATSHVLCYAYGAAPLIGFVPAALSMPRFLSVDVVNAPASMGVYNEFTGKREVMGKGRDVEPMNAVATYDPPGDKHFYDAIGTVDEAGEVTGGVWTDNRIVKVSGGKVIRNKPFSDEPEEGRYSVVRWKNLRLKPTAYFPMSSFGDTDALWRDLNSRFSQKRGREEYYNPPEGKGKETPPPEIPDFMVLSDVARLKAKIREEKSLDRVPVKLDMRAEVYDEVAKKVAMFGGTLKVTNDIQQMLLDVRRIDAENGVPFDWEEPFFERINLNSSALLRYDPMLIPHSIVPSRLPYTEEEGSSDIEARTARFIVKDPFDLMAPYAGQGLKALGMAFDFLKSMDVKKSLDARSAELEAKRAAAEAASPPDQKALKGIDAAIRRNERDRQAIGAEMRFLAEGMWQGEGPEHEEYLRQVIGMTSSEEGFAELQGQILEVMNASVDEIYQLATEGKMYEPEVGEDLRAGIASLTEARSGLRKDDMMGEFAKVKHYLMGFQWLAARGAVGLSPDQFVHSFTAAPSLHDAKENTLDLDEMMIPKGSVGATDESRKVGISSQPYAPPFSAQFPTMSKPSPGGGEELVYACRKWDVNRNEWVVTELPRGVKPRQGHETGMKGMRVQVPHTRMVVATPDGRPFEITCGEAIRYRTSPDPEGNDAIIGGCYDSFVAPELSSSKGSDKEMVEKGMGRYGFGVFSEEHAFSEPSPTSGGAIRRHFPDVLFKADPEANPDEYRGEDDGTPWDVTGKAFKKPNGVFFADNVSAYLALSKVLGKSTSQLGPKLVPLDINDQRLIDSNMQDAILYANSINAYREESASNASGFFEEGVLKPPPEGADEDVLELYGMVAEGMKNSKSIDQDLYEYGMNCQVCGKDINNTEAIRKTYNKAVAEAMKDPASAFKRKTHEVFCVAYLDEDNQEHKISDKMGNVIVFGSQRDAERHIPAFRDFPGAENKELYVTKLGPVTLPYAMKDDPEARYAVEEDFARHVQEKHPPVQQDQPEEAGEPIPQSPTEVEPPSPEPAVIEPPLQEQVVPVQPAGPAIQETPPQQAIPQAQAQAPAPTPQQPKPEAPKPGALPPPPGFKKPPAKAAVIERLVALADKLDSEGRKSEADSVDRVLRMACQNQ